MGPTGWLAGWRTARVLVYVFQIEGETVVGERSACSIATIHPCTPTPETKSPQFFSFLARPRGCPVSRAPHTARRTGCGVQLRVSTTTAPGDATAPPSSPRHHPGPVTPAAPVSPATVANPATCEGTTLYYPSLLSDALEFLGAGLCWRLDKAFSALHLAPRERGIEQADGDVVGGPAAGDGGRAGGEWGATPTVAGAAGGVRPLQGPSNPADLLVAHVLRIDAGTMEAASAGQVGRRAGLVGGRSALCPVAVVRWRWFRKGGLCGTLFP